jgi:hypothetical protein
MLLQCFMGDKSAVAMRAFEAFIRRVIFTLGKGCKKEADGISKEWTRLLSLKEEADTTYRGDESLVPERNRTFGSNVGSEGTAELYMWSCLRGRKDKVM